MAKKQRFASVRIRSAVIATSMLGVLLVSLALAQWFTTTIGASGRPIPRVVSHLITPLEVELPEDWQRVPNSNVTPDTLAVFSNPDHPGHQFRVVFRRLATPATPIDILQQTITQLKGSEPFESIYHTSVRDGSMWITHYIGVLGGQTNRLHHLSILTEDAQRYWVLDLSEPLDEISNIVAQTNLMHQICQSVTDHGLLDAEQMDLKRAAIWFDAPSSLRTRIPNGWDPVQPVLYIPHSVDPQLWLIRLRCVPPISTTSENNPLSPATLLAQRFEWLAGRPPSPSEQRSASLHGVRAWSVVMNRTADAAFSHQLWYVQPHVGRAILVEVLLDGPATHIDEQRIITLVEAAVSTDPEQDAADDWGERHRMDAARDRGVAISDRQRGTVSRFDEEWSYHLINGLNGAVVGFAVEHILPAQPDRELPRRGRSKTVILGTVRAEIDQQWAVAQGGSGYRAIVQRSIASRHGGPLQWVMTQKRVLEHETLSATHLTATGQETTWSVPVPLGYILPAYEDIWPLEGQNLPALVWLSRNHLLPQPYWIDAAPANSDSSALELRIRPMMGMDADILTLDQTGRVVQYRWVDRGNRSNARVQGARRVDRDVLLEQISVDELERLHEELSRDDYPEMSGHSDASMR